MIHWNSFTELQKSRYFTSVVVDKGSEHHS